LVALADEELAQVDIVESNLDCAAGLPAAERIDRDLCLHTIEHMADQTRFNTANAFKAFERRPEEWNHSPGIFRIHVLVCTLQREFGARYNSAKIPFEVPLETDDSFIHGIIQGQGGTCASLPPLYVAVGRRLGYPLKLVSAACVNRYMHLFVRWDDPEGERFNIEVNKGGLNCPPDDHYRQGPYHTQPAWEETGSILSSMKPRQELACFLAQRAARWRQLGQARLEAEALAWAVTLAPDNVFHRQTLLQVLDGWHESLKAIKPPAFPALTIVSPEPGLPRIVPEAIERDLIGLTVAELLLKDPVNDRTWWQPLRRGAHVHPRPAQVIVHCRPDGGYDLQTHCS